MGQKLGKVVGLAIEANTSPCAHICRYCSIGDRGAKFPVDRWTAFVERFVDWKKTQGPEAPEVQGGFFGPSYNFDLETFTNLNIWAERVNGFRLRWIPLGGLKMRPESDMREWLLERQRVGVEGVGASFVGHSSLHDCWNGRSGDFDFLLRTLRTAGELGLKHCATLYLTKSSLPLMEELVSLLDGLPTPHAGRHVRPFYYIGHGAHHDAECITEEDRKKLPSFVYEWLGSNFVLRSEREWIEAVRAEEETPQELHLHLELTNENIDRLEAMSCDAILADLESRMRATLAKMPTLRDLAETYGDRYGTKIYSSTYDMRRLWLYRFLDSHPMSFDHSLMHYHLGRSLNPPSLRQLSPGSRSKHLSAEEPLARGASARSVGGFALGRY